MRAAALATVDPAISIPRSRDPRPGKITISPNTSLAVKGRTYLPCGRCGFLAKVN